MSLPEKCEACLDENSRRLKNRFDDWSIQSKIKQTIIFPDRKISTILLVNHSEGLYQLAK